MSPINEMYKNILSNIDEIFQYFRSPKTWWNLFIKSLKKKG